MNKGAKFYFKLGLFVFLLYLCILYWHNVASFLGAVLGALSPLLIGCVVAYPLNILMSFYERHFFPKSQKKVVLVNRRWFCLVLAIITLLAIVALVFILVIPQLISCFSLLIAEIPGAINSVIDRLYDFDFVPDDLLKQLASIDWQSMIVNVVKTVSTGIGSVMVIVVDTVTSVLSGVTTGILAIIFSVYLLLGKDKLSNQIKRVMKRFIKGEKIRNKISYALSVINDSFHRFIVGQCTEAVILGVLCTIGMLILQLPYAPMIGAVMAFTAFIPVVGAFIGGGIGVFLILMQSPVKALIFLVFIIVLQQIEGNVIYPRVVGSSIGLPGIWVLAAVTIGGGVFGVFGMLLGVPLAAAAYRLLRNEINQSENNEKKIFSSSGNE